MISLEKEKNGFIALISAIIISAALLSAISALSFTSYFIRFDILEAEYKDQSAGLAEACVETALLKLANDNAYSTTNEEIPVGVHKCTIVLIDPSVSPIEIRTSADVNNFYTNYLVKSIIAADGTPTIASWEEVANF